MAFPTIVINASTGSDTQASGAGPATALFGTAAATTNGSNIVTLSVDAPDLSGVATDGSAAIWVLTSAGRRFNKVTSVDNTAKTVTCEDNFTVSDAADTWGLGGKRATLAGSSTVAGTTGAHSGWTISLENNETISATFTVSCSGDSTNGVIRFKGDSASTRRVLTCSANASIFTVSGANTLFENFEFQNTNGTKTSANGIITSGAVSPIYVKNCVFGNSTNTLLDGIRIGSSATVYAIDCEFKYCTGQGGNITAGTTSTLDCLGCISHHNTGAGFLTASAAGLRINLNRCASYLNSGSGVKCASNPMMVRQSTFDANSVDGFEATAAGTGYQLILHSNNFTNNTTAGVALNTDPGTQIPLAACNNFYGNGSARVNFATTYDGDIAINPGYTDAANGNFIVTRSMTGTSYPLSTRKIGGNPTNGTTHYGAIGCAEIQVTASNTLINPGLSGGLR